MPSIIEGRSMPCSQPNVLDPHHPCLISFYSPTYITMQEGDYMWEVVDREEMDWKVTEVIQ